MSRAAAERREHVDETEHLHLEMFVAHRERHHPLVKAGLAENRFRIAIDQLENRVPRRSISACRELMSEL